MSYAATDWPVDRSRAISHRILVFAQITADKHTNKHTDKHTNEQTDKQHIQTTQTDGASKWGDDDTRAKNEYS